MRIGPGTPVPRGCLRRATGVPTDENRDGGTGKDALPRRQDRVALTARDPVNILAARLVLALTANEATMTTSDVSPTDRLPSTNDRSIPTPGTRNEELRLPVTLDLTRPPPRHQSLEDFLRTNPADARRLGLA